MDAYNELLLKYEKLLDEYETYQNFAESNIQILNDKNSKQEKKLDAMSSIVEISKYINFNVIDDSLLAKINDMIIGILGVNYSTIYFKEGEEFNIKATNIADDHYKYYVKTVFEQIQSGEPFILNSKEDLFDSNVDIHSILGSPISLRDEYRGYIIVEQSMYGFFCDDHINFINAIANQVAIAVENSALYKKVRESSIRDPLLGIYNRKYFFDIIEKEIMNRSRYGIIMLDIDDFKSINDTYGHQFGDEVLIQTSNIVSSKMGNKDILARYGGEELIVFINDVNDRESVFNKIDIIRSNVENNVMKAGSEKVSITVSIGIAYSICRGENVSSVVKKADEALYMSKASGKNKVVEYNCIGSVS